MKRLSFILFALIFIPLMGVARAQGGGTIVVSEKAPSILVHYEQPPSGWVSTGADVHSWILFKNTHPWYEIGYNTSYDGADSPAYDVTEISEMFHFEMYKDDYTYVDIDYGDAHHGKINLRTEINGETLSKNSLRDYVQLHFPAYEFLEREITIDGYDGFELYYVKNDATHQCCLPDGVWDAPLSILYRYILLDLTGTESLLIEVDGYASVDWVGEPLASDGTDAIEVNKEEFDRIAHSGFEKLNSEVDQILNGLQIEVDGKQPKEDESQEKGAVWEFVGTDVSLQGDATEPTSGVAEWSCGTTNYWSWALPPQFLYVGEKPSFYLGAETRSAGEGEEPPWTSTELWLDGDGRADTLADGDMLGSTEVIYPGEKDQEEIIWQVPGGSPGDQLALAYTVKGPAGCEGGAVVYLYEYKTFDKAPEADKTADSVTDEEAAEDILNQLAGMEGIGNLLGPETTRQALIGVVAPAILIAILAALGQMGGSTSKSGGNGGDPPPDGPQKLTLRDALGRQHEYEWSPEDGGYINPETDGMLDPALWDEYNRNLAANEAFNQQQREKIARRDTDFDRQVDKMLDREKQHQVLIRELEDLKRAGYRLGPDGARASSHADRLLGKVRSGQPVSSKQIAAVERFIRDRQSGRTEVESSRQTVSEMDVFTETVQGSVRTAITAKNPDGSISWPAMVSRVAIAINTGGASEWAMIPAESGYIVKDCMDRGASVGEAVATAGVIAAVSAVAGKAIAGGLGAVAKGAGWVARGAAKAAGKHLPGASAAAKQAAKWLGKGVTGLGEEFKQTGQVVKAVAKRMGIGGTRAAGRKIAGQSARSALTTPAQRNLKKAFTKAVAEGDDQALMGLYKNGGMKRLAALEQGGHMTPQQVKAANKIMSRNMNRAIKEGTESSIEKFERETGVRVKEVLLGDSGSSAKGTARSILTDYDRTVIASFDDKAVDAYAKKLGVSTNEARQRLGEKFMETHKAAVGDSVKRNLGVDLPDVDYAAYNGIGAGAGPADSYPLGFTNARQSVSGTGTRTYRAANGQIRTTTVSGDAIVDANALKSAKMGGEMVPDPTRIGADEMSGLLKQQAQAAAKYSDAKSLAKAVERSNYVARRLRLGTDPRLSKIARQISDKPQNMNTILQQNGISEAEFVKQTKQFINDLAKKVN